MLCGQQLFNDLKLNFITVYSFLHSFMFIEQQMYYLRKKTCIILKIKNLYQNFLTFSHLQFLFTTLLSELLLQFPSFGIIFIYPTPYVLLNQMNWSTSMDKCRMWHTVAFLLCSTYSVMSASLCGSTGRRAALSAALWSQRRSTNGETEPHLHTCRFIDL